MNSRAQTFKERLAEAGKLLVKHLTNKKIVLRPSALKTARRNYRKYYKDAWQEWVHRKSNSIE